MIIIEVLERRMRGDLVEKTLGIKLRKRRLSVAKMAVSKVPRVKLFNGLFHTKEGTTSMPTTPPC